MILDLSPCKVEPATLILKIAAPPLKLKKKK